MALVLVAYVSDCYW